MRILRASRNWLIASVLGVFLVGVAVGMAEREPAGNDGPALPEAAHAEALSKVFRHVANEALPSVVSITTRGRVAQAERGGGPGLPFDEDHPFFEFFQDDPRLREFFRGGPGGRMPERPAPQRMGLGSGIIIDSAGTIMTNTHVVRDAEEVRVRLHDGREFIADDIRMDPRTDIAVIRIDAPNDLKPIRLGDSDEMEIGDWVLAVGSPFGMDLTVTSGIISAKGRGPGIAEREDFLQTDAAINPGNSGGPLLNLKGEVIGINTAISTRSGGSQGVGFTIPVNMAKWVAEQLIEKGEVSRAYLGVAIQPVDSALAQKFQTPVGQGVIVNQVMPESPAADADLQVGDVILEFNGEKVFSPRNLQGIVERLGVDDPHEMVILRDGREQTISVTLRAMPEDYSLARRPEAPRRERQSPSKESFQDLGIEIRELTPEAAEQLGLEEARGVLVDSVEPNSPAQRAGLRSGDVIEEIDRKQVASSKEFAEAMQDASLEEGVLLLVRNRLGTRFVSIQVR